MRKLLTTILFSLSIGIYAQVPEDNTVPTQAEIDEALQQLKNSMIYVEGGTFMMGATTTDSHTDANQLPAHQVTLSSFYVSKYEVIQALWRAVMGRLGAYSSTSDYTYPVTYRSHDEIQEFIEKLNQLTGEHYRLLTEAEWEFAARGGNQSKGYIYAGSNDYADVSHGFAPPGTEITEIIDDITITSGSKVSNELGLYNMSGNAAELVEDNYYEYTSDPQVNPLFRNESGMVVCRGGGVASCYDWEYRVTARMMVKQHSAAGLEWTGFRLAKDANQQSEKRRSFIISYSRGGEEQQTKVGGIRFVPSQYGTEAYAWQSADDEWQSYTSLAADGFDIQNVRSISRTRIELAAGKGEELQLALEEEARSGTADVNAIVAALKENPNVADAQTDGINVMVREENDSAYDVYPLVDLPDYFAGMEEIAEVSEKLAQTRNAYHDLGGKVVIFNYFSGIKKWSGQNNITYAIRKMFETRGFEVFYHDYEDFTKEILDKELKNIKSDDSYIALIIMTHGFWGAFQRKTNNGTFQHGNEQACFVLGEEQQENKYGDVAEDDLTDPHPYIRLHSLEIGTKGYHNLALPMHYLDVGKKCLLYMGSCFAFRDPTILPNCRWMGWDGANSMAQSHACLTFSRMLEHHMNLDKASSLPYFYDPAGGELKKHNTRDITFWHNYREPFYYDINTQVEDHGELEYYKTPENKNTQFEWTAFIKGEKRPTYLYAMFHSLVFESLAPTCRLERVKETNMYKGNVKLYKGSKGIFEVRYFYYPHWWSDERIFLESVNPSYVAVSDLFPENSAIVLQPAKDSKIVMTTAKASGEQLEFGYYYDKDVWFDMNNNGIREAGEYPDWETIDYTTFRPTVQSQTFTIYGDISGSFDCGSDNFEHDYNRLTSIDMSEFYGGMEQLFCAYNELTELILPKGTELKYVWAADNKLSEVDASGLPFLETLMLSNNSLISIKLPESYTLRNVDVQSNHQLSVIDVSNLPNLMGLHCQNCIIEELDVSQNPELTELLCDGNRISALDLSANQQLLSLGCNYNQLDKEALENIYQQLPDVSGDIDSLEYKLWLPQLFRMLRANGNPGYSEADQSIATKKCWEFEDKWNYGTRSSQQTVMIDGSGVCQ